MKSSIGIALGYLRHNPLPQNPLKFGIEMEVEFPILPDDDGGRNEEAVNIATDNLCRDSAYWSAGHDGSLRNGVEYKTMGGLAETSLDRAIQLFYDWLPTSGYRWSQRCSTHVHVNVLDLDILQLHKFLGGLLMFEDVLFDHVARERTYSNFCAPFYLNTHLLDKIGLEGLPYRSRYGHPRNTQGVVSSLARAWSKYTSINLKRLTDLGTVEFRGGHLIESREEMFRLLGMLGSLKRLAMESPEGEKYFKYITRISKMDVHEVLEGLESWYTRDADSSTTCLTNALLISRINTAVSDAPMVATQPPQPAEAWSPEAIADVTMPGAEPLATLMQEARRVARGRLLRSLGVFEVEGHIVQQPGEVQRVYYDNAIFDEASEAPVRPNHQE